MDDMGTIWTKAALWSGLMGPPARARQDVCLIGKGVKNYGQAERPVSTS